MYDYNVINFALKYRDYYRGKCGEILYQYALNFLQKKSILTYEYELFNYYYGYNNQEESLLFLLGLGEINNLVFCKPYANCKLLEYIPISQPLIKNTKIIVDDKAIKNSLKILIDFYEECNNYEK